jgi:hypothetical protein
MVYFSACKNRSICLAPQTELGCHTGKTQVDQKNRAARPAYSNERGCVNNNIPLSVGAERGQTVEVPPPPPPPSISHDESHVSVSFGIDVSPARSTSLVHGVDSTIPSTALAGSVYL